MKHKYAEMIKAKADNMELVLLINAQGEWNKSYNDFPADNWFDYFLCHPKHVNETIHWLNGGETQLYSDGRFCGMPMCVLGGWCHDHVFMDESRIIRIKPKKEKRWIVVNTSDEASVTCCLTGTKMNYCSHAHLDEAVANYMASKCGGHPIEIEVEV